jgi:hypothetical protein
MWATIGDGEHTLGGRDQQYLLTIPAYRLAAFAMQRGARYAAVGEHSGTPFLSNVKQRAKASHLKWHMAGPHLLDFSPSGGTTFTILPNLNSETAAVPWRTHENHHRFG